MCADLVATLEYPLPSSLPVGSGTAVFCFGSCFHRRERVVALELVADGARLPVAAAGMPRPDLFATFQGRSFRSGFWATLPIAARSAPGAVELALVARLANGVEEVAALGRIPVLERDPPPALCRAAEPGLIAICMATFEPDPALFRAQVESLRAQTNRNWVCVISDDGSRPEYVAQIDAVLAGDPRFLLSRSEQRRGFYRNFEHALRLAPAEADLVALCDQDDRWFPEKLDVLQGALGASGLVYCDQRLVDASGRVLRETLWAGRSNNHTDLASMLVANTITGAAALMRREIAELALPFPDPPGLQFHDHWLGLVALAAGDVAYVDRPLYDYVQHGGAFFGAVTHGAAPKAKRGLRGGRGAYFRGYLAHEVQAQALLVRCAGRLTAPKRRALQRYVAAVRSPAAFAWFAARPLRALRGHDETLGSEVALLRGIVWRRLLPLIALGARRPGRRPLDASLPDLLSFEQRRLRRWRAGV